MYIERDIKARLEKVAGISSIVALVGARQAGKTTFLKEQAKGRKSSYVLFDDPDVRGIFEEDIKKFERQYIEGHDVSVLDEVQYCKDAGIKLKYLTEMGHKIWLTSSSEVILGKDILSFLVGRVSVLRMYPFSFHEFLASKSQTETIAAITKRNVWEHMTYGGYPKVVMTGDTESKKIILSDLYETMVLKDIARAFSLQDIGALEQFTRLMALSVGEIVSYDTVSSTLKLSFQTVKKYFDAAEKSYLMKMALPFFTNKSKEITKQPKVYFIDTGLRNAVVRGFPAEPSGKLFENYVFSETLKGGFTPKYWRTKAGAEVDFVVEYDNGTVIPIEVKLTAEPRKIERGLRSFIEEYGPKKAVVVTYGGSSGETKVGSCRVVFTDIPGMIAALTSTRHKKA